jgi:hypothetical protein
MSAATTHCDRIITMIDDCLAAAEASTPPTVRAQPLATLAPGASWWRLVPTGHPLGHASGTAGSLTG